MNHPDIQQMHLERETPPAIRWVFSSGEKLRAALKKPTENLFKELEASGIVIDDQSITKKYVVLRASSQGQPSREKGLELLRDAVAFLKEKEGSVIKRHPTSKALPRIHQTGAKDPLGLDLSKPPKSE